jgi:hypothetical protein
MGRIIGIDIGTCNSAAAIIVGGKPTIIPSAEGATVAGKTVPCYVAFTKDGIFLVGKPARRQAAINPEATVTGFKRLMGTKEKITILGKDYTPEQISAFLLQKIRKDAEAFLGEKVTFSKYLEIENSSAKVDWGMGINGMPVSVGNFETGRTLTTIMFYLQLVGLMLGSVGAGMFAKTKQYY